jgi:hypothetical protein
MSTTASSVPSWAQEIAILVVGCISVIIAVYKYVTTQISKDVAKIPGTTAATQVVAASFTDSKLLKELIDALREHSEEDARIALRLTRSMTDLREALVENAEAARIQADSTLNLIRFIGRKGDS